MLNIFGAFNNSLAHDQQKGATLCQFIYQMMYQAVTYDQVCSFELIVYISY